jgi:peptidylprolyl isomerase
MSAAEKAVSLFVSLSEFPVIEHVELEAGLTKTVITRGTGVTPSVAGVEVTAHYTGKLADGTTFDSSRTRGRPFVFRIGIGAVISAWDIGIASMCVGERAIISSDAAHGYGSAGAGGVIPPNASLFFDVELLSVGAAADGGGFCSTS